MALGGGDIYIYYIIDYSTCINIMHVYVCIYIYVCKQRHPQKALLAETGNTYYLPEMYRKDKDSAELVQHSSTIFSPCRQLFNKNICHGDHHAWLSHWVPKGATLLTFDKGCEWWTHSIGSSSVRHCQGRDRVETVYSNQSNKTLKYQQVRTYK